MDRFEPALPPTKPRDLNLVRQGPTPAPKSDDCDVVSGWSTAGGERVPLEKQLVDTLPELRRGAQDDRASSDAERPVVASEHGPTRCSPDRAAARETARAPEAVACDEPSQGSSRDAPRKPCGLRPVIKLEATPSRGRARRRRGRNRLGNFLFHASHEATTPRRSANKLGTHRSSSPYSRDCPL